MIFIKNYSNNITLDSNGSVILRLKEDSLLDRGQVLADDKRES